jgi:two-component system osmolarity sensor histidine kinase EnvZ
MRDRIQRQMTQRTEMLAGVSHDLRTPLTRMKLELTMLGDSDEIQALQQDVADMEMMIGGYLAFARGEGTESPQPTDVTRLLNETVNGARRDGMDVMLDITADITPDFEIPLRANAVKRCIANLLVNAVRHASRAWVTCRFAGSAIEIIIDDDGPGIPVALRSDVFKPFFRLDESRNADTGGTGLGLTIARDIARSHGGDLTLDDSPLGGLRAIVRIPI